MYVTRGEREVKLIISEDGAACIVDGKNQTKIESSEAVQLLADKGRALHASLARDIESKAKDTFRLAHICRVTSQRLDDINNLILMLGTVAPEALPTAIPDKTEVEITWVEPPKVELPKKEEKKQEPKSPAQKPKREAHGDDGVIMRRKKVFVGGLKPIKNPEFDKVS